MGIIFKARGTSSVGLLLIRLTLGSYTLALGIMQASDIQYYIGTVRDLGIMSENLAFIVGFALPFILIFLGALYILGFFTVPTSLILALISIIKISARGFFPMTGIPFHKEVVFFACFLATLFAGAGVISLDAFLDRKKKRTVTVAEPKTALVTAEVATEQQTAPSESGTKT
jgi:uncharacterized membrane protein YphA (DoxX/SURF4 family)